MIFKKGIRMNENYKITDNNKLIYKITYKSNKIKQMKKTPFFNI